MTHNHIFEEYEYEPTLPTGEILKAEAEKEYLAYADECERIACEASDGYDVLGISYKEIGLYFDGDKEAIQNFYASHVNMGGFYLDGYENCSIVIYKTLTEKERFEEEERVHQYYLKILAEIEDFKAEPTEEKAKAIIEDLGYYSDWYKDVNGIRPRWAFNYELETMGEEAEAVYRRAWDNM